MKISDMFNKKKPEWAHFQIDSEEGKLFVYKDGKPFTGRLSFFARMQGYEPKEFKVRVDK